MLSTRQAVLEVLPLAAAAIAQRRRMEADPEAWPHYGRGGHELTLLIDRGDGSAPVHVPVWTTWTRSIPPHFGLSISRDDDDEDRVLEHTEDSQAFGERLPVVSEPDTVKTSLNQARDEAERRQRERDLNTWLDSIGGGEYG